MLFKRSLLLAGALALLPYALFGGTHEHERITRLEARIARLEAKIDAILRHLGIEAEQVASPPSPEQQELLELLRQGHKLHAIKRYRELYGVGLKEAKDAIEALAREMRL